MAQNIFKKNIIYRRKPHKTTSIVYSRAISGELSACELE